MKISVVIPNWKGADKLRRNLPTVLKLALVDEVIVVDDASPDDSVKVLEQEFPQVRLVKRLFNGGFSSAVNDGVDVAQGELVFVLNTDAAPERDCLKSVIPHFKDDKVFSVGCNTGGNWAWAEFKDGFFWHRQSAEPVPNEAHQTLWAGGGSGIFRKSVWDQLNGLDELFNPFYEEDLDIGYRAQKRGYINLWEPRALVEHYRQKGVIEENFSKAKVTKIAQRNHLFIMWKNLTSANLTRQHLRGLTKYLLLHPGYWGVFWLALIQLPEVLKKRAIEKSEAKVTDEAILTRFKV